MRVPRNIASAFPPLDLSSSGAGSITDREAATVQIHGRTARLHWLEPPDCEGVAAVVLPLDALFEVRAAAALRFYALCMRRSPSPNPAALSAPRRARLTASLRALDARLDGASYRVIAATLFGPDRILERGWKTHDLRDRTIRLVRDGKALTQGGYRQLLLYPYRRRP